MPECIQRIGSNLELFYDLRHQRIYQIMVQMYDAQEAIDLVTLSSWLGFQCALQDAGGDSYLITLPEAAPSAANISYYLGILEEKYRYRRLIQLGTEQVSGVYDQTGSAQDLIEKAATDILGLCEDLTPKDTESTVSELIPAAQEQIEHWHQHQGVITGVATGFPDLDKMTTGFHPGDMVIIAGRPSLGKTSLAMNIVDHVAVEQGMPVGVFSLEMTKASLTLRLLCSRARVNLRNIQGGFLSHHDFDRLTEAAGKLHHANIYINDQSGMSILALRTRARRMAQQYGIRLLVVDYLQLMHAERNRNDSREHEVSLISGGLKHIAKELGIPVIAVSQLNRAVEQTKDRRPNLSSLRESGSLEQDADLVAVLWRPAKDDDDNSRKDAIPVNLEIMKQRNGPTGTVPLCFLRGFTRFESAASVTSQDVPEEAQQQQEFNA